MIPWTGCNLFAGCSAGPDGPEFLRTDPDDTSPYNVSELDAVRVAMGFSGRFLLGGWFGGREHL